jgi:hypothetical protein
MSEAYRVSNPGNTENPARNPNPAVVRHDWRDYEIPIGGSQVLPETIARHALAQHPWLTLSPVTARYEEVDEPKEQHNCSFPGCNQGFANFGSFAEHMKQHFTTPAAPAPVSPAEPVDDDDPKAGAACVVLLDGVSHEGTYLGATPNGWLRVRIENGSEQKARKAAVTFLP